MFCFSSVLWGQTDFFKVEVTDNGKAKSITNNKAQLVTFKVKFEDGTEQSFSIEGGSTESIDSTCTKITYEMPNGQGGGVLWSVSAGESGLNKKNQEGLDNISEENEFKENSAILNGSSDMVLTINQNNSVAKRIVNVEYVLTSFLYTIENDPFLSLNSIENDVGDIRSHIEALENWKDGDAYITDKKLEGYLKTNAKLLDKYQSDVESVVDDFLANYAEYDLRADFNIKDSLVSVLAIRLSQRGCALDELSSAMREAEDSVQPRSLFDVFNVRMLSAGIVLFVVLGLITLLSRLIKRRHKIQAVVEKSSDRSDSHSGITVIRKTMSVLLEQNIDDVVNNNTYLMISCSDFCHESAVNKIYIKNTCIIDIYNMYAEDLRNPNNPKEDGCMVLGRWVYDEPSGEYAVSLEEIVQPGDDAVFQEYELNFGGIIKMKVSEKLRKLRRNTNLQYDLTCWVHSHPGLGIFFSNSDSNVHMQLKHPSHPKFLIAIVVDILTPQLEFGIFTFRNDSTINSRNDITKLYSLEKLYKWAVESNRNSYKIDDCFEMLHWSQYKNENIPGIQLNNGAIIDIASITIEQNMGLVGWAYGCKTQIGSKNEFIIKSVLNSETSSVDDMLGCLVVGNHCSIPSIRSAVSEYVNKVSFVMFYSVQDEMITTIPIVNMELVMDEKLYSEVKLEVLKEWTRRKR